MKRLLLLLFVFLFASCSEEIYVSYELKEPVSLDLYAEGYFSTDDSLGQEQVGTITAAYAGVTYSSVQDTLKMQRIYQINKSRGYLKNYMPSELLWRVDTLSLNALDRDVLNIYGLEGYDSLVNSLPMPKKWKDQLLNPNYKKHLIRAEKHRFEMTHLLKGKVPEKANITDLLKSQGRLNFALIGIDSVVTEGFQNLDKRRCFTYSVYFTETESFPYYIWEQHVNTGIVSKEFQKYNSGLEAEYKTKYQVAFEMNGGILCQEREVKEGIHTMVNKETGDTAKFQSNITLERLYTKLKK